MTLFVSGSVEMTRGKWIEFRVHFWNLGVLSGLLVIKNLAVLFRIRPTICIANRNTTPVSDHRVYRACCNVRVTNFGSTNAIPHKNFENIEKSSNSVKKYFTLFKNVFYQGYILQTIFETFITPLFGAAPPEQSPTATFNKMFKNFENSVKSVQIRVENLVRKR